MENEVQKKRMFSAASSPAATCTLGTYLGAIQQLGGAVRMSMTATI